MDEILIEEKKYVSSKRAAEMTGYAKDYVGQLCREGRVPARLIGRSWYVLEAAIQDHRFGNPEEEMPAVEPEHPSITSAWESPRYEAISEPEQPVPLSASVKEEPEEQKPQHIQDSWKEWFDHFEQKEEVEEVSVPEEPVEEEVDYVKEPEITIEKDTKVNIPIRAIHSKPLYQPPPEEFLPRNFEERVSEAQKDAPVQRSHRRKTFGVIKTIQVVGAVLAVMIAITAVIGSGYLDKYILSNSPTSIIAGAVLYNRK